MTAFAHKFSANLNHFPISCRRVTQRGAAALHPVVRMLSARIFSKLSVRARVIALGLIPVVGFLANGVASQIGDGQVGRSFDIVQRDTAVADASHDLKSGLLMMRAATLDFVARPSGQQLKNFESGQHLAISSLDRIQSALPASQNDIITPLRTSLNNLKTDFDSLVDAQRMLGFDESEGTTADLIWASNQIEKTIQHDLSWVADLDAAKLMISILTMRHYEIEYRLSHSHEAEQHFLGEVKNFNALFDAIDGAPALKQKLDQEVQHYSYAFENWVETADNIKPILKLIDHDTESVLPDADQIIVAAQGNAAAAASALAASRERTRQIIVAVGIAFVMIGLVCSFIIGRSITRPPE